MGVPNTGFRLFGRIRIVLWPIQPNKNTNSVGGRAFWRCTCCCDIYHLLMSLANYSHACMLSSHDPLPFIRLPKSGGLSESSWHWLSEVCHRRHKLHYTCTDQLFVFVLTTLFVQIRMHYSQHYSAPKRIFNTSLHETILVSRKHGLNKYQTYYI